MVARAIFTTKIDVLPWPSLKDKKKKKENIKLMYSFKRSCEDVGCVVFLL